MPENFILTSFLSKAFGGLAGSLIALAIIKPTSALNAVFRTIGSIIIAFVGTTPLVNWIPLENNQDTTMLVSVGIGLFGWFLISIALGTLAHAKNVKELKEKIK